MNNIIWLVCAAINIGIALLHLYIIYAGAPAYRYFGAGEWMVAKAEAGSLIPVAITLGVTCVFLGFALYNLAGSKITLIPLPWVFYALLAIATVYILRGSIVVLIPFAEAPVPTFDKIAASLSLSIGLLHAAGVYFYYTENIKA